VATRIREQLTVIVIPMYNPDGAEANIRQPESRAWYALWAQTHPRLALDLHHMGQSPVVEGTNELNTFQIGARSIDPQPDDRAAVADEPADGADLGRRRTATRHRRREAHGWIRRTLACGEPAATPASVAGLAAASTLLPPWDDQAALDLAQRAAQLASGLGDIERARAAEAVGMAATYGVQSDLALAELYKALALFDDEHP
jgi:hypothetical protein